MASPEQADPYFRASDYLIEVLRALAPLLTLAGFVVLHRLQVARYGGPRGGWRGFRVAVVVGLVWIVLSCILLSKGQEVAGRSSSIR